MVVSIKVAFCFSSCPVTFSQSAGNFNACSAAAVVTRLTSLPSARPCDGSLLFNSFLLARTHPLYRGLPYICRCSALSASRFEGRRTQACPFVSRAGVSFRGNPHRSIDHLRAECPVARGPQLRCCLHIRRSRGEPGRSITASPTLNFRDFTPGSPPFVNSTPAASSARTIALSVLARGSVKLRSIFLIDISERPEAAASSACVHPTRARAARIWAGTTIIMG